MVTNNKLLCLISPATLSCALPIAEDKQKPGEAMLEQYRKAGKPIPPQVEKMAEWLDKMDDESAQDVPMVKPGQSLTHSEERCGGLNM